MRSFIFDFNGTLFQDTDIHRVAWKRFMAEQGMPISDEDFRQKMNGPGNDIILRRFFGDGPTDAEIDALSEAGVVEMFDAMKKRAIPCCVATASIRANVDFYMEDLGLNRWFDYSHIFYMTGEFPGKPDPAIYLTAMRSLAYVPSETVVVEDSLPGMRSALSAGVGGIIAVGETVPPAELAQIPNIVARIHDFYGFERFFA